MSPRSSASHDRSHAPGQSSTAPRLERRHIVLRDARAAELVRDVSSAGAELWVTASGVSMLPLIPDGARVLLGPLRRPPRVGDVLLAALGRGFILHRVVDVDRTHVALRGDAFATTDPPVTLDRVLARAIAVRRGGRVTPLSSTLRFGWRGLVAYWQSRAGRLVRRTRALIGRVRARRRGRA